MPLHEMTTPPESVIGDVKPWVSMRYRNVPQGIGLGYLTVPSDCPMLITAYRTLARQADAYFAEWEIEGNSLMDFQNRLKVQLDTHADTLERLMEVYQDDIAKPILGRTEVTEYGLDGQPLVTEDVHTDTIKRRRTEDVTDTRTDTQIEKTVIQSDNTHTETPDTEQTVTSIDVPVSGVWTNPTSQSKTEQDGTLTVTDDGDSTETRSIESGNVTDSRDATYTDEVVSGEVRDTRTQSGAMRVTFSDLGVTPNYEILNGYLDYNRTLLQVFIDVFRPCFTLHEVLRW